MNMSAKQLFDHVSSARGEGATTPYETAVRRLFATKLTSSIGNYCNEFMQNYIDVNSVNESLRPKSLDSSQEKNRDMFTVTSGLAGFMFIMGTEDIEWLDTWRHVKVYEKDNRYFSLDIMMSAQRQVTKGEQPQADVHGQSQFPKEKGRVESYKNEEEFVTAYPNQPCQLCEHMHKNKNCFRHHLEMKRNKSAYRGSENGAAQQDRIS